MTQHEPLQSRFEAMWPHLNEKLRRLWAAAEAVSFGYGGITAVHDVTGLSRSVIIQGTQEVSGKRPIVETQIRRPGAGRKAIKDTDVAVLADLKGLLESSTRGDPESPLVWTTQSLRTLAEGLAAKG